MYHRPIKIKQIILEILKLFCESYDQYQTVNIILTSSYILSSILVLRAHILNLFIIMVVLPKNKQCTKMKVGDINACHMPSLVIMVLSNNVYKILRKYHELLFRVSTYNFVGELCVLTLKAIYHETRTKDKPSKINSG